MLVSCASSLPLPLIFYFVVEILKDLVFSFRDWDPPAFSKSGFEDLFGVHDLVSSAILKQLKSRLWISHMGISPVFLRIFNGYSNDFEGPLLIEFVLLRFLEQLNLRGSYFKGEISAIYGRFTRLKLLDPAGNAMEGTLPRQLRFLTQLERIEIGYNAFTGTILFTSEIPASHTNLKALKVLDLSDNQLSGAILEGISSLTELTRLSSIDNFSGTILEGISELPNLNTSLLGTSTLEAFFHGNWNNFTGEIPKDFGCAPMLQFLNTSENSFNAASNIWGAPSLQIFSANSAKLTGEMLDFISCKNVYKIKLSKRKHPLGH
ncbi:hypothetical protein F3Y22_tig00116996pilonHSYRG00055 [Hibiscus syriacus]|uniref:Uncharacterized protein n=1 Tax=Hibiscus syriacus TaxID=106335 RepID=A0A6A2X547_HIBSY|nr:hypothetical protein F3Y22_tig00116996pilonHSYRG00055 [Hibiscus syriacus]